MSWQEEQNIKPQYFTFRWLTLLLSQEFLLPDVIRIWDTLFSDKERFHFLILVCCAMLMWVSGISSSLVCCIAPAVCFLLWLIWSFLTVCRLIRENLLAGDFTVNMRLLQVRFLRLCCGASTDASTHPRSNYSRSKLDTWISDHVHYVSGLSHLRCPHHPSQGWRAAGQLLTCWRTCLLGAWTAKRLKHGGFDEWRSWTEARLLAVIQQCRNLSTFLEAVQMNTLLQMLWRRSLSHYPIETQALFWLLHVWSVCSVASLLIWSCYWRVLLCWCGVSIFGTLSMKIGIQLSFIWHTSNLRIRPFTCFIILFI